MNEPDLSNLPCAEEIYYTLIESVWISRWNEEKTALTAVLTVNEAHQIVRNIITNLKLNGFKIDDL